jgi:WD40 repeat protein/serine/threonine protein kinase
MNEPQRAPEQSPNIPPPTIVHETSAQVGTVIGPYKLMEQIGEGGFGLVFVAEQLAPVRRKVAVKVIKPGMDTRDVIARFEAERQALAMMDHPNIARVLDAGATESGRPYFVMELVRGVPITDYCDKNRLTPRERLELFVVVCQAVQHAHQKGIIHRDLKPSNVMVTLHDGRPLVKVIDFGVAKALHQSLTEKTIYTRFAQMVGTPLYMSPEQAEMGGLDIDTRTDIYSLGVMMYELLTGTTPFDKKRVAKAAYDELIRMIREEEPPKPSTRLSQSTASLPAIAEHRRTEPARLSKMFRGDLDWITMKALEKDRTRRYESASGLAADVQRYLHDEPVEASPPSAGYRLRKLARRHRAALVTSAAFAVLLIGDAIGGTWMAFREKSMRETSDQNAALAVQNAQRAQAETENAQAERGIADQQRKRAEAERGRADANAARADQGRQQAEKARNGAEAEKQRADANAAEAERRRAEAVSERNRAEELSRQAEHRVYAVQIAGAHRDWDNNDVEGAWQHLDKCRTDLRGWEYGYLLARFTQNQRTLRGHQAPITCTSFSPDGRRIVSSSADGTVKIWEPTSGRLLKTLDGQNGPITSAAFSPDGKRIVAGSWGNVATVWDASSGREVLCLAGHARAVSTVAFSPDGKQIVSGSWDETLKIWDAVSGRALRTLKGHTNPVTSAVFNRNGTQVASGAEDSTVRIWDVASGQEVRTLKGHSGFVSGVAFSPEGDRVASSSHDGTVRVWDVASGKPTLKASSPGSLGIIASVAFSPDGKKVVSGDQAHTVKLWDAQNGRELLALKGHTDIVTSVGFSPDGTRLVSGANDAVVKVWVPAVADQASPGRFLEHLGRVTSVAFSPDGQRIAGAAWNGTIKIWDAADGRELVTLHGRVDRPARVAWSPDGKRILTESFNLHDRAKLWDASSGNELLTLAAGGAMVSDAAFSPDGKQIAGGCFQSPLRMWEAATGKVVQSFENVQTVNCLAYRRDGKQIVCGTSLDGITIYDASNGKQLVTFQAPPDSKWRFLKLGQEILEVAFSPNAKYVVSRRMNEKTLVVWDALTGQPAHTLEGHSATVTSLAFSPDGQRILSGSEDSTLKLWDVETGEETLTLKGHTAGVESVAWSPDGRRIVSSGNDGTIRLWDASAGQAKPIAETRAGQP